MINYSKGYIAFIDILGFSDEIKNSENGQEIYKVITAIQQIKDMINDNPQWNVKMAFFSDSIVLTSEKDFLGFLYPIRVFELLLQMELGLSYRGGITNGEFYHDNNIVFGPAMIDAYHLENKAEDSRIIICCDGLEHGSLHYFKDYDGRWCINPYSLRLSEQMPAGIDENDSESLEAIDVIGLVKKALRIIKNEIADKYLSYQTCYEDADVSAKLIRKNIWRIIPFNFTCDYIINNEESIELLKNCGEKLDANDIDEIRKLKFSIDDIVQEYGYGYI